MLKILGGTERKGEREETEDMKHKLITTLTMGGNYFITALVPWEEDSV